MQLGRNEEVIACSHFLLSREVGRNGTLIKFLKCDLERDPKLGHSSSGKVPDHHSRLELKGPTVHQNKECPTHLFCFSLGNTILLLISSLIAEGCVSVAGTQPIASVQVKHFDEGT
jgi:hypothetical protein